MPRSFPDHRPACSKFPRSARKVQGVPVTVLRRIGPCLQSLVTDTNAALHLL
jgi:hypothetical protein